MAHHEDFAGALSVAQDHLEHVVLRGRGHVAHRQWFFLDAPLQRLPEVVESDATLEHRIRLVGHQLTHAQRARRRRVVAMHDHHRRTLRRRMLGSLLLRVDLRADGVVEHDHAPRAD